ncbi:LysR family transcriptional regulator [Porticoccus sp.]|jgi:DNA-binding transcriptional LysR family regulator|uniref:LysR family transcriptional regulator n=1 Tax=Porticoccus sp. TaxID=2024853 RepID=UPI000C3C7C40|nr:LysR family transcriptional regulator [Porticoccus sp.]MAZ69946.1 LysR family transcriptional regulator [Porticoccus sp.]|tara:strand:+ start:20515 stop:21453 length:939 start_codon:yes stop_codon:yes gene_type:complete
MNIRNVDLNLLVYLDVLLKERNVTRAAENMGISQPAMSNGLRRLRDLFNDPLLVRTSDGMTPTERAEQLQPIVREVLASVEKAVVPRREFNAAEADRVFRISVSDYTESTLLPHLMRRLRSEAPNITLDVLTPSDISYQDVEQGSIDLVINRFDVLPQSFHQMTIWRDTFSCVASIHNPIIHDFTLDNYLESGHVWVSKTGMGVGVGMEPGAEQRLGWVDEALTRIGKKRRIRVFTRHYQAAMRLAELHDLVVTLPTKAASLLVGNPHVTILKPPFEIPEIELKMAWSPLLQHNPAHQWIRRTIADVAKTLD